MGRALGIKKIYPGSIQEMGPRFNFGEKWLKTVGEHEVHSIFFHWGVLFLGADSGTSTSLPRIWVQGPLLPSGKVGARGHSTPGTSQLCVRGYFPKEYFSL